MSAWECVCGELIEDEGNRVLNHKLSCGEYLDGGEAESHLQKEPRSGGE